MKFHVLRFGFRKFLIYGLWTMVYGLLLVGCAEGAATAKEFITITDGCGYEVEVPYPAQRLVVVNSDSAEILCALGVEDRIIGITDHIANFGANLLSELKDVTIIGSSRMPNTEMIVELKPDVVIATDMWRPSQKEFADQLTPFGIPVVRVPCYRINRLADDVRILGRVVGKEKEAEEYIRYFKKYLDKVEKRLGNLKRKVRVYAEGYGDYKAVSFGSGAYTMLGLAGVDNIAGDKPIPYPEMSPEWAVIENPEVIIKAASSGWIKTGYGFLDVEAVSNFWKSIVNRPVWDQIDAVRNGRVYLVSYEIWTGPRTPIGMLYIAKWCYPELVADIDPEAIHREWLLKWHKKELKGIYVYPIL